MQTTGAYGNQGAYSEFRNNTACDTAPDSACLFPLCGWLPYPHGRNGAWRFRIMTGSVRQLHFYGRV